LEQPKSDFVLPFADIANSVVEPKMPSNRNSVSSSLADEINYFPYIYHVSTEATPTIAPPLTWYDAYTAIHDYWSRPNTMLQNQPLPTPVQYFSANKTISKARFLMRYYFKSQANAPPVPTHKPLSMNAYQSVGENASMQEQKKWMELASAIRTCIQKQNKFQWNYDYGRFERLVSKLDITLDLDWYNYFLQSCYGVQYYSMNPNCHLRTCVFADQHVSCALYQKRKTLIDAPFPSVMYTEDEMKQRIQHMIEILITSLQDPSQYLKNEQDLKPIWIEYLNDTLEDWCDESRLHNYDATRQHWLSKVDENDEMLKISVINNQKVGDAIIQASAMKGCKVNKG
jgi:hypothetical protein